MDNTPKIDWKYFIKKHFKTILLIALAIGISIPLLQIVVFWGIWGTFGYFANIVTNSTGMNPYLAKIVVMILLAPLVMSFKWSFAINPLKWKTGYIIIFCYAIIFYAAMFIMTKDHMFNYADGTAKKYYAKTPQGIKYYDAPGVDPDYGIKLKPVTPEMRRSEAFKDRPPQEIKAPPSDYFDFATGEPLYWYYLNKNGKIDLFDQPGFHPKYRKNLKPITNDIVKQYERQLQVKIEEQRLREMKDKMEEDLKELAKIDKQQKKPLTENDTEALTSSFKKYDIELKVDSLNFYEAGEDSISQKNRSYKNNFSNTSTRYIWFDLKLSYPMPNRNIEFPIDSIWYRSDGSVMKKQSIKANINSNWDKSRHTFGCGSNKFGEFWEPGIYRVELFVDSKKIAIKSFQVF